MNLFSTKFNTFAVAACLSAALSAPVFSQVKPPAPPAAPVPYKSYKPKITSEKSLAVDAKVTVSLCVLAGNLKINGWDRSEIRVFVQKGTGIDFKVSQANQNGSPVWVRILRGAADNQSATNECLTGGEIEIDLPRNAALLLKGQETRTTIDSIRRASVKTSGGYIFLNNISEGIEAQTYEGDITAENCGGAVNLESATGNITAFEAAPSDIGDVFKAKTGNGAITLQNIAHRQIEANSISGTISFDGKMSGGGLYSFSTSNGSILMTIPKTSSFRITAAYGFGDFDSEIPLNDIKRNAASSIQRMTAALGSGDATLNLTTNSGRIKIKDKK